jgi:hypothetical protein
VAEVEAVVVAGAGAGPVLGERGGEIPGAVNRAEVPGVASPEGGAMTNRQVAWRGSVARSGGWGGEGGRARGARPARPARALALNLMAGLLPYWRTD